MFKTCESMKHYVNQINISQKKIKNYFSKLCLVCNTRKNEIRAKNRGAVCLALGELGHYRFLVMHKNRSLHFTFFHFSFGSLVSYFIYSFFLKYFNNFQSSKFEMWEYSNMTDLCNIDITTTLNKPVLQVEQV